MTEFPRHCRGVIYVPIRNHVVLAVPKAGSTSIREAAGRGAQVQPQEVPTYQSVRAFLREPLTRFESTFRYFKNRQSFPNAWEASSQSVNRYVPDTLEEFTDLVLDKGWWDKHWLPQTANWTVDLDLHTIRVHRFEDLSAVMADLGVSIPHSNASGVPKQGITYRRQDLEDFYREDLEIREVLR